MTPPNQDYTLDFENMTEIAQLYNSFLTEYATSNHHYLCDTAELTPTVNNFYDECHFNTQGAKNISVIIGQCIDKINGEHSAH
jgi:hypothetical protein